MQNRVLTNSTIRASQQHTSVTNQLQTQFSKKQVTERSSHHPPDGYTNTQPDVFNDGSNTLVYIYRVHQGLTQSPTHGLHAWDNF